MKYEDFNDTTKEIKYSDFKAKRYYKFILLDIMNYLEQKHNFFPTMYIIFEAMACDNYPELNIKKKEKAFINFTEKTFKEQWRRVNKEKYEKDKMYDVLVCFRKNSSRIFSIKHIEIVQVTDLSELCRK